MASTPIIHEESDQDVEHYSMHVSQRYLDLTRRKLELTRLAREPQPQSQSEWSIGTPKASLEPLIDFWLENYSWRQRESHFNHTLPQFRTTIPLNNASSTTSLPQSLRVHYVHKSSNASDAVPLLYCHGWPGSFLEIARIIDALTAPSPFEGQDDDDTLSFHLVCPSVPGFGYSEAGDVTAATGEPAVEGQEPVRFGLKETAEVFDALMRSLGYDRYVVHGSGWGFPIARLIALNHPSCLALHTSNSNWPPPSFTRSPLTYLEYHIARLTQARLPFLQFGYIPTDFSPDQEITRPSPGSIDPDMAMAEFFAQRPQTSAFALCDSPAGLLALMLDALHVTVGLDAFSPTDILDWTMMHWLPGPEAGLRWLKQASVDLPVQALGVYCATPLGVSVFRCDAAADDAPPPRDEEESSDAGASGTTGTSAAAGSGRGLQVRREGPPLRPRSPPMWAQALQRLCWVKRHGRVSRRPVWDASEELVGDLRECFKVMIRAGVVSLDGPGPEDEGG